MAFNTPIKAAWSFNFPVKVVKITPSVRIGSSDWMVRPLRRFDQVFSRRPITRIE